MKSITCLLGLLFGAFGQLFSQSPVILPDLKCTSITKSGGELVVQIENLTTDQARKCAPTTASITFGGTTKTFSVPELGAEDPFEKRFSIPANLLSAPIVVVVKVDVNQKINESNENNNTTNRTVNVPDLTLVVDAPGSLILRQEGAFRYFSIKNTGDGEARSSTALFTYYYSGGRQETINIATPAIPAGQSVELKVVSPEFGVRRWDVKADFQKQVKESDENNNTAEGGRED